MNQQELVNAIARHLYHRTRRDIAEVLTVMQELCTAELARPGGSVYLHGLGRLSVDRQTLTGSGFLRGPVQRLYFRFRPAAALKQAVLKGGQPDE